METRVTSLGLTARGGADDEARPLTVAEGMVAMLHNSLRRKRKGRDAPPSRWAQDFDALLERYDKEQVLRALRWYCDRVGAPGAPVVLSARGFLRRFPDILRAMDADPGAGASASARAVAAQVLRDGAWPGQSAAEMPRAADESLRNYGPFRLKVLGRAGADRLGRFCLHLAQSGTVCAPDAFVRRWFAALGERYLGWAAWDGRLDPLVFTVQSRHLQVAGRRWSAEWCGSPFLWDALTRGETGGDERSTRGGEAGRETIGPVAGVRERDGDDSRRLG